MLNLKSVIKAAFADFSRNKLRTILTTLGIMIGIAAVVLLLALGLGLKVFIERQFEGLGRNIVIVMPGSVFSNGQFRPGQNVGGIELDEKDFEHIAKIENIAFTAPAYIKTVSVSAGGNTEIADIYATNEEIFPMRNLNLTHGEYYTKSDIAKRSKKAVIGPKIAKKLFKSESQALNQNLKINNTNFRIIGVIEPKGGGGFGGPDFDSFIYIPYKSVLAFNPGKKFSVINAKVNSDTNVTEVKKSIERELLKRYERDDFSIVEQKQIESTITSIFSILNSVLVAIGAISLLVGGIGIMNIMLASVIERYREIGIRRALGATRSNILIQFLSEAILLSTFGGVLGLLLSSVFVLIIRFFFPAYLSVTAILVAIGVSSLIGIFFGVVPAVKAARLSPVEAIRYE